MGRFGGSAVAVEVGMVGSGGGMISLDLGSWNVRFSSASPLSRDLR